MKLKIVNAILFACLAQGVSAQNSGCENKGTNGMVSIVLCPTGLDYDAWKEAGEAACGARQPCGAWIWDNPLEVPASAPARHDELPGASVRTAKAIWVNEKSELLVLKKN